MKACHKSLILASAVCLAQPAIADINFNGFASFKMGMTMDDDETIYGYDDSFGFKEESLAGLQASADLGDKLSFTTQILTRGSRDYDATFEWAYFKYQVNDENAFTAGRIRIPFYKYSEYIDVGYAYHWIRPPQGVYSIPFNSWDGIGWTNTHYMGGWDGQLQLQVGHVENDDLGGGDDSDLLSPLTYTGVALEYTISNGNWSGRLGYSYAKDFELNLRSITGGLALIESQFGPLPEEFKSNILFDGGDVSFASASLFYDPGNWFIGAEATQLTYEDVVITPDSDSAYLTTGMRFDDWVVHATYEVVSSDKRTYEELTQGVESATEVQIQAMQYTHTLFTSTGANAGTDSNNISVGANYQFHPSATLKLDLTQYENDIDAPGGRTDATLLSFGIDMVF